jgi:hypothetical protein
LQIENCKLEDGSPGSELPETGNLPGGDQKAGFQFAIFNFQFAK